MSSKYEAWWTKTKSLSSLCLAVWFVAGIGIHFLAPALNDIQVFGFPFPYFMAAQGSLLVFVALSFWYSSRQNVIDLNHDAAEDE